MEPVAIEVGGVDDGFDICDGEASWLLEPFLKGLAIETCHQAATDQLHEVGLPVGEADDVLDGVGVVVEREVGGRLGDQPSCRRRAQEADGDGGDATKEKRGFQ